MHHRATPLHLGFSCYLFDRRGQVLLTRRALTKRTWPECDELVLRPSTARRTAVRSGAAPRRHELGLQIDHLECVLPHFRYRATATDGTVENELCPVFSPAPRAGAAGADEVMDWRWVSWPSCGGGRAVLAAEPVAAPRFCCWRMPTLGAGARAAGTGARV
ncbi:NUDIX domain protein [Mycobacterium xenopi 4042]|uniref:NUDIX domain protein n=1 Tax=Mycobacterium xenopi 4042 TaxID=1299334 RepID=X8EVV4_MYCXE|nr:NUDIX domain protein [Mycobacterium xenopi 4042]